MGKKGSMELDMDGYLGDVVKSVHAIDSVRLESGAGESPSTVSRQPSDGEQEKKLPLKEEKNTEKSNFSDLFANFVGENAGLLRSCLEAGASRTADRKTLSVYLNSSVMPSLKMLSAVSGVGVSVIVAGIVSVFVETCRKDIVALGKMSLDSLSR